MGDPLSTASGVLALTLFAFKSSTVLYQLVESFRSNQRTVRELKEELEALNGVLKSLQETAACAEIDLTMLKLPLLACGKACKEFEAVIIRCTAHSNGPRSSFRDWAKLKYLGDDIAGFKNTLAGYKSTISVALGDANMRTAAVTATVLREYKELISNTTADLEEHLDNIDSRLQSISTQGTANSDEDTVERQQMQEERYNIQYCLDICSKVLMQIEQVQPNAFINLSSASHLPVTTTLGGLTSAQQLTAATFITCKENLTDTTNRLERQLRDVNNRLNGFSLQPTRISREQVIEQERLQEEKNAIKKSLDICAEASKQANQEKTNVFEDISLVDDSQQVIISTIEALITAKHITGGSRSIQVFGQLSDESFRHFVSHQSLEKVVEPQPIANPEFEGRYGTGVKLSQPNVKVLGKTLK